MIVREQSTRTRDPQGTSGVTQMRVSERLVGPKETCGGDIGVQLPRLITDENLRAVLQLVDRI